MDRGYSTMGFWGETRREKKLRDVNAIPGLHAAVALQEARFLALAARRSHSLPTPGHRKSDGLWSTLICALFPQPIWGSLTRDKAP